jgi:hypothetical protein
MPSGVGFVARFANVFYLLGLSGGWLFEQQSEAMLSEPSGGPASFCTPVCGEIG